MSAVSLGPALGRSEVRALGTTAEVLVTESQTIAMADVLLRRQLEGVDLLASRFRADSELSLLNASAGRPTEVSEGLADLVEAALRAARLTDGLVDPTVGAAMARIGYDRDFAAMVKDQPEGGPAPEPAPGWQTIQLDVITRTVCLPRGIVLDLGATAKAMAADRAAALIAQTLSCGTLVSIGGDISISGPPPEDGWSVGLSDVSGDAPDQAREVVALQAGGLATSGTSARSWVRGGTTMHHIVDPRTGLPVDSPWRTVAVAAASCVGANIAATGAMLKGPEAPAWLTALGLPALLVSTTGAVVTTGGWPSAEGC